MEVELKNINKTYGRVWANRDINLHLKPGRIYGLLGENGAGKSTLMRILAGHTQPDRGDLVFDGRLTEKLTPKGAFQLGVGMLYQDPLDFPAMKVWENFVLGGIKQRRQEAVARLQHLAGRLQFQFDPDSRLADLTVGERQQIELLRLMDAGIKTLILDEPTTGISLPQKVKLFATLKTLAEEQDRITIIVTHKLSEAQELCDEVLIMRQGGLVDRFQRPFSPENILRSMFGPETETKPQCPPKGLLEPKACLKLSQGRFIGDHFTLEHVDLKANPGEIIGLAGLEGSGQELLLRGLAGLIRMTNGDLSFHGETLRGKPYPRFRNAGIHFLPSARLEQGLFPDLTLSDHVCLAFPDQKNRLLEFYEEECRQRFNLMAAPETSAKKLSGGNQQRLLLSLIPAQTRLLLMEHPTRGLDLGSARQVWSHLEERCRQGAVLLFSSADLDEILERSHSIMVFYNRRVIARLDCSEANQDLIGSLMAGRKKAA